MINFFLCITVELGGIFHTTTLKQRRGKIVPPNYYTYVVNFALDRYVLRQNLSTLNFQTTQIGLENTFSKNPALPSPESLSTCRPVQETEKGLNLTKSI